MADSKKPQTEVHLYVRGKGPKQKFKHDLMGWDADRLDLSAILQTYRLKAVYAYSLERGRGLQLVPNPRNGLSRTVYTGREGSIVRLDSDAKVPLVRRLVVLSAALGFAAILAASVFSQRPELLLMLQSWSARHEGWPLMLVGILIVVFVARKGLTSWYR